MKKSILFLILSVLLLNSSLQAAQTDWSNNGIVNMARVNNQQWNNFFTSLNKKNADVDTNITITKGEFLGTNDSTAYIKLKISLYNQSINGVIYKYKTEIWYVDDSSSKGELYSVGDFSSGIMFQRQPDSGKMGYMITEWDNNSTRKHNRISYFLEQIGTSQIDRVLALDTYEYSDKVLVYGLTYDKNAALYSGKLVVSILGAVISKTSPYNTVIRQGWDTYDNTLSFEKGFGSPIACLIGEFNDNSSFSNGWIVDGYALTHNFTADTYPDPSQLSASE